MLRPNGPTDSTKPIERRRVLQALGGTSVVGLAGCLGSDDESGEDDDGGDDDAMDGSDDDGEDDDSGATNADDSTTTDDESEEAAGDDSVDGSTAEITFLGETHTSSGSEVGCFDGATEDILKQLLATFESDRHVGLQIRSTFYDDHVTVFLDGIDSSSFDDDHDGADSGQYANDVEHDDVEFDIDSDENFVSGTINLEPYPGSQESSSDGIEVEFDIRCSPHDSSGDEPNEGSADGADDIGETETDDETIADGDEAVHPADLDIDPEDGWGEPHDGVEIPDEPGRAVLVIDGERFEFEGICEGGEVHAEDEDEERRARGEYGHFAFRSEFHSEGEEDLLLTVSRVVGIGRIAGTSDRSRTVEEADEFALGGDHRGAWYQYLGYADGGTERLEGDGVTEADESFVRIDPSGVITANGVLERAMSRTDIEGEEVPTGEFEFGARCQGDWDEDWREN